MEFRLLGSLEVWDAGHEVGVPGAKRRALLAILLLHRNHVVTRDRLIDLLWGERPPSSAVHGLDVHVSNLRSRLPDGGRCLRTRPGGYLLQVEVGALDLERFESLAEPTSPPRPSCHRRRCGRPARRGDHGIARQWRRRPAASFAALRRRGGGA